MFSKFASVPQNELLGNGNFLAQAYTILAGLNVVVQSLSSQELLASQLNALGGAHQARGATPIMFEVRFQNQMIKYTVNFPISLLTLTLQLEMKQFGEILTGVLAEELGSAFNAEAKSAWKSGLAALVAGISKTLK
jgi:hypothetical protein